MHTQFKHLAFVSTKRRAVWGEDEGTQGCEDDELHSLTPFSMIHRTPSISAWKWLKDDLKKRGRKYV